MNSVSRCRNGHPLDEENTVIHAGQRRCLFCRQASAHRHRRRSVPKNEFVSDEKEGQRQTIWATMASAMFAQRVAPTDAHVLCLPYKGAEIPTMLNHGFRNIWLCDHSPNGAQILADIAHRYNLIDGRSYHTSFEVAMQRHVQTRRPKLSAVHFDSCANKARAIREATAIFRYPVTTDMVWLAVTFSKGRGEPRSTDYQRLTYIEREIERYHWTVERIAGGQYQGAGTPMLWGIFECHRPIPTEMEQVMLIPCAVCGKSKKSSDGKMHSAEVDADAKLAETWLAVSHPSQRPPKSGHVQKLATAMSRGKWKRIAHGPVFDDQGYFVDAGQRFNALIQAAIKHPGITLPFYVTWHQPSDGDAVMDQGLSRNLANAIQMMTGVKPQMGAVQVANRMMYTNGFVRKHALDEQVKFYVKYQKEIEHALSLFQSKRKGLRISPVLSTLARASVVRPRQQQVIDSFGLALSIGMEWDGIHTLTTDQRHIVGRARRFFLESSGDKGGHIHPGAVNVPYVIAQSALKRFLDGPTEEEVRRDRKWKPIERVQPNSFTEAFPLSEDESPTGTAPATNSAPQNADFSAVEVSKLLGNHLRVVQGWIKAGNFPGAYKVGIEWRIPSASLHAFQRLRGLEIVDHNAAQAEPPIRRRRSKREEAIASASGLFDPPVGRRASSRQRHP